MDISLQAEQLYKAGARKVRITYDNGQSQVFRIFQSTDGRICHYRKNSRKYGYPLSNDAFSFSSNPVSIAPVTSKKSQEQKWIDGWTKVSNRLKTSQLWSDIVKEIAVALKVGHKRMNQAYDDYWKVKDYDYTAFAQTYPELVRKNDKDELVPNSSIIWSYAKLPKVKKMRFVKRGQDITLSMIAKSMQAGQKCSYHGDNGYDASFEYNHEKKKAWYSEEYRGCGNGHYYIALDSTHALFYEDD